MNIASWIDKHLEDGTLAEEQVIVVYDRNNNIAYFGKAGFSPLSLRDHYVCSEIVGHELHINEGVRGVWPTAPTEATEGHIAYRLTRTTNHPKKVQRNLQKVLDKLN